MHEVGHTLGLRHNFKASAWKDLKQIDDKSKGPNEAIVASVMDYNPANIAPAGNAQGYYYTPTIGPYDYWAIEYGYKEISGKRVGGAGKNRRPRHRAGPAIRDGRGRRLRQPTRARTCSTWATTRSSSPRGK